MQAIGILFLLFLLLGIAMYYGKVRKCCVREDQIRRERYKGNCLKSDGKDDIREVVVPPTDGKENLVHANDVFKSISSRFEEYGCDVTDKPTTETSVEVYDIDQGGSYSEIFSGFDVSLDLLCFTQAQIKAIVEKYYYGWELDILSFEIHFLFKVDNKFFVAKVRDSVVSRGRCIDVARFENGRIFGPNSYYNGRNRVVVPMSEYN